MEEKNNFKIGLRQISNTPYNPFEKLMDDVIREYFSPINIDNEIGESLPDTDEYPSPKNEYFPNLYELSSKEFEEK
jgi:hypothetical protein